MATAVIEVVTMVAAVVTMVAPVVVVMAVVVAAVVMANRHPDTWPVYHSTRHCTTRRRRSTSS